jgi:hypothetical protein
MKKEITTEIVDLHQFFQDWFNGDLGASTENFSRLGIALAPNFKMITPQGNLVERAPLVDSLNSAHNSRTGMRIWIKNVVLQHQLGETIIATYEEWQEIKSQVSARLSSATFKFDSDAPNGVAWVHLHETWLPAP